ncbi:hypothetical protein D3C76_982010 [compost metagenome]
MLTPVFSAAGMNTSGASQPRSGCSQRTRAAMPSTLPLPRSISGRNCNCSSSCSSACLRSLARVTRSPTSRVISSLWNWNWLRPFSLARYRAMSDCASKPSALRHWGVYRLMPMLDDRRTALLSR